MSPIPQSLNFRLPTSGELQTEFKYDPSLFQKFIEPLHRFSRTGSKKIRTQLLFITAGLVQSSTVSRSEASPQVAEQLADLIETLHSGSIIIDDVQDESEERRGNPPLHFEIGVPLSINAGGWLYSWAIKKVESIDLGPETKLLVYQYCADALYRSHLGQALDLGFKAHDLSSTEAIHFVESVARLKTGTLTALATTLGSLDCAEPKTIRIFLRDFGESFGQLLQACNDLSEFTGPLKSVSDDLLLLRPTVVVATAAKLLPHSEYQQFLKNLDEFRSLSPAEALVKMRDFANHSVVREARIATRLFWEQIRAELKNNLDQHCPGSTSSTYWDQLGLLGERLLESHGV